MMGVDVQIACAPDQPLPSSLDLARWARAALDAPRKDFDLTVRIVDAEEGLALNRDYRGGQSPTNVLSFPFSPDGGVTLDLLGDVVICAPVIAREAAEQGKSLAAHYAHMVVHGVLHLQGLEHDDDASAEAMEGRERDLLLSLGFPDPYEQVGQT